MAPHTEKVEWRCVWMDIGEQCVVRDGGIQRLVWSVLDWDSQEKVSIKELLRISTAHTELKRKLLLTGAMIIQYSQGTLQSIYTLTCPSPQSDPPDCTATPAPHSCDHSMDLGVRCSSHQEVCESMHDESETTATVSVTEVTPQEPSSTLSISSSLSESVVQSILKAHRQWIVTAWYKTMLKGDLGRIPTKSNSTNLNQFSGELMTTNKTLGVLTGLLAAALVVVTMGWIVSCVYWQRRNETRWDVILHCLLLFKIQTERKTWAACTNKY